MHINFRNAVVNVAGESVWGLQSNAVASATVLTVLLKSAGAGEQMIAAISSIEMAMAMIPQVLGAWVFRSRRRLKVNLVIWHLAAISPWLFLMGLLALNRGLVGDVVFRWMLLGFDACMLFAIGVVLSAWTDWQAHVFPARIRGRAFGASFCGSALAGTIGGLIAGWVISVVHEPLSYAALYFAASVLSVLSLLIFLLVRDPAEGAPEVSRRPTMGELATAFRSTLWNSDFRSYLAGRILGLCGFSVLPFIAVYFLSERGGALSSATVVSCGATMTVGMAVGNVLLGYLGDARGHRICVAIGYAAQIVALAILLTASGVGGCILAYLAAGFCSSGTWSSHSNMVIEGCPHDYRMLHISATNLVMGVSGFAVPLAAGAAAGVWGIRTLFVVNMFFSAAALGWTIWRVTDPRSKAQPGAATNL